MPGRCPVPPSKRAWQRRTRGNSSAGRALRSQCRGRGFDPPVVHHFTPDQIPALSFSIPEQISAGNFRSALIRQLGHRPTRLCVCRQQISNCGADHLPCDNRLICNPLLITADTAPCPPQLPNIGPRTASRESSMCCKNEVLAKTQSSQRPIFPCPAASANTYLVPAMPGQGVVAQNT